MEPLHSHLAIAFHIEHLREVDREVAEIHLARAAKSPLDARGWPRVLPRLLREALALR